jgi:hypothetical protein
MLQVGPIALSDDYTAKATFGPYNDAASLEVQIVAESADLQLYRGAHGQEGLTGPIIAGPGLYPFTAQARTIGVRARNHVKGKNASMWARVWFISDPQPGAPVGFGIGNLDPVTGAPIPINVNIASGTVTASPIGAYRSFQVPNPAAGVSGLTLYTVPGGATVGAPVYLTYEINDPLDNGTSGGAGPLVWALEVQDPGGNVYARQVQSYIQSSPASGGTRLFKETWIRGGAPNQGYVFNNFPIDEHGWDTNWLLGPLVFIPTGFSLVLTLLMGIFNAASTIGNIFVVVEEF